MKVKKLLLTGVASAFMFAAPLVAGGPAAFAWTGQDNQISWTDNNGNSNNGSNNEHIKVTLCHATGNGGYVEITVNANGAIHGHAGHPGDIIPPFDYNSHGTTEHFAGLNWDINGQAIFNNGCKAVGGQGGGPQKDCDNDFDNSSQSECQTPQNQKDCDNDFDNSPQTECQTTTPPTTGGQGGVTGSTTPPTVTTTPQVLGASTTVAATTGGAGATTTPSTPTPTELPNTGVKSTSGIWSSLAILLLASSAIYWREMIVPFIRRK